MILYVPPDAPLITRVGADLLLAFHVGGGLVAVTSGAVALGTSKGSRPHRTAGDVFVVSMLVMGAIGAAVSPFLPTPQPGNVVGGILACYLVATGWMAVRSKPGVIVRFEYAAFVIAASAAAAEVLFGLQALAAPGQELAGVPYFAMFGFALVSAGLAASDLSVIIRGGLVGAQRLARHLWRMNVGLLLALGSGLSQPRLRHLLPHDLQSLPVLIAPVVLIFAYMVYWLVRLSRRPRPPRRSPAAVFGPARAGA